MIESFANLEPERTPERLIPDRLLLEPAVQSKLPRFISRSMLFATQS